MQGAPSVCLGQGCSQTTVYEHLVQVLITQSIEDVTYRATAPLKMLASNPAKKREEVKS